jgi:hypothetical protein
MTRGIDLSAALSPEEPSEHKWTILQEGKLLPVTVLLGMDGQRVGNPLHAFRCVVRVIGGWQAIRCEPGEIWPVRK